MKLNLIIILIATTFSSCMSEQGEKINRTLLKGTWKGDSTFTTIGNDTIESILDIPIAYDTLERWSFMIFNKADQVYEVNFPSNTTIAYSATYMENTISTNAEIGPGMTIGEDYILDSLSDETLVLKTIDTSNEETEVTYHVFVKVDSIEATKNFYDQIMLEQATKRKLRYDSIISRLGIPDQAVPPSFPGGVTNFYKLLQSNLVYPKYAKILNIQGKSEVGFTINKQGKMVDFVDVKSAHGMLANAAAEALEKINEQTSWKPATLNETPIAVFQIIPVNFQLNE